MSSFIITPKLSSRINSIIKSIPLINGVAPSDYKAVVDPKSSL
jgi:hypothetical protein